ncbi:unnamed protein product [Lymnaea stagnalis]|uniref:rRNA methyltransferase 1, mitochondrial n=1 Tax=Lymnaea stagnalis TaxID=6523 RepID=A0AAV2ICL8_LYMST
MGGLSKKFIASASIIKPLRQSACYTSSVTSPGYNYGLSGKGKSKSKVVSNFPVVKGEVLFGLHPVSMALKSHRRDVVHNVFIDKKFHAEDNDSPVGKVLQLASKHHHTIKAVSREVLDQLSGNRPHQGVCMDVDSLRIPEWCEQDLPKTSTNFPFWLLMQNIMDPMNFGAILRTAYYLGLDKIIVPANNSCRPSPVVSKASAGAMEVVDLVHLAPNTTESKLCSWWKDQGGEVVGTGVSDDSKCIQLNTFKMTRPTLLILGNEGSGISKELEEICDTMIRIPGQVYPSTTQIDSLNVSVAAGILMHWMKALR